MYCQTLGRSDYSSARYIIRGSACTSTNFCAGTSEMSYPKYMTDEQLSAFGFEVLPNNSMHAQHKLYPRLSIRYRCPSCNLWASRVMGGAELVCEQCAKGGRPIKTAGQFDKLYQCCTDSDCETWAQVVDLLEHYGVAMEPCHDGFGSYHRLKLPANWSQDERLEFHARIGDFSVSRYGGRKVQCNPRRKMRSKLPGSRM
jgi:hypothetical protein